MSERRPTRGALKLADDAVRTDDARRQLLADWCRLVGTRVNGPAGTMAAAAEAAARGGPASSGPTGGESAGSESESSGSTTGGPAGSGAVPQGEAPSAPAGSKGTPPVATAIAALGLPPRVAQVLIELLAGASEKQIAVRLSISPHTVHTYVKQLHKRLNVASRGELLARFVGPVSAD